MNKKIIIIITGIFLIVLTVVFISPLQERINELTEPIIVETDREWSAVYDYELSPIYIQMEVSLILNSEDLENDIELTIPSEYYIKEVTMGSNAVPFKVQEIGGYFLYNGSASIGYTSNYFYYDLYTDPNTINLTNLINYISPGKYIFNENYVKVTVGFILVLANTTTDITYENDSRDAVATDILSYSGFIYDEPIIDYTPPQIEGTTATLINIIPFVLISAVVFVTFTLVKKEGD